MHARMSSALMSGGLLARAAVTSTRLTTTAAAAAVSSGRRAAVASRWSSSAASASASASSAAATPAAASAAAATASRTRSSDLYRSPLRDADDRTYAHLWQDAWTMEVAAQRRTVIWLHGLAQNVSDLKTMCEIIAPPHTKMVVPQAPKLSITCLSDAPDQRAWFDLLEEKRDAAREAAGMPLEEDEYGIEEMTARVHELIRHEMSTSQLPSSRILLAGFGEGGALALHAALTFPERLAGAVSVAGYLPLPHLYPDVIHSSNARLPLLTVHGNSDAVVPIAFAKQRYAALAPAGLQAEMRAEWSMGHFVTNSSLMSIHGWMANALDKSEAMEKKQ